MISHAEWPSWLSLSSLNTKEGISDQVLMSALSGFKRKQIEAGRCAVDYEYPLALNVSSLTFSAPIESQYNIRGV